MFSAETGQFIWSVDTAGYEIDHDAEPMDMEDSRIAAWFYRPESTDRMYEKRGVVRAKGGEKREYTPMQDAPGLARRLAGLYPLSTTKLVPTDEDILRFVCDYGLLVMDDEMPIRDIVYAAKYLSAFTSGVDNQNRLMAIEIFNERVIPRTTVRLKGSTTGKPTANCRLDVEPTDLISAAWLQMAAELTHGKKLQKCEAPDCLEWFPERSNKRFCNNRCKMAFHKQSRDTRLQLEV